MRSKITNFKKLLIVVGTSLSTTVLTYLLLSLIYSSESFGFYDEIREPVVLLFLVAFVWFAITFLGGLLVSKIITKEYRSKFRIYNFILSVFIMVIVIYVLIRISNLYLRGSFIKGTKVLTPSGIQPIENLKTGDQLISYDDKINKYIVSTVLKYRVRETTDYYLINNLLGVTAEHPIAIRKSDRSITWQRVRELNLGEKMIGYDNNNVEISNLEKMKTVTPLDVYNPQTSFPHNYFVIIGNTPVLVHNKTH